MCPPTHFRVEYSLNPWMNPTTPVDTDLAIGQWEQLRDVYRRLGHVVDTLVPNPDLPDMVFTANGATVIDGRALVSRFRHVERAAEAASYLQWLPTAGLRKVRQATFTNEGEGDHAVVGGRILAGAGFRSDQRGHAETRAYFGRELISLRLVDPRYYHLDTALAVLDAEQIMYYQCTTRRHSRSPASLYWGRCSRMPSRRTTPMPPRLASMRSPTVATLSCPMSLKT